VGRAGFEEEPSSDDFELELVELDGAAGVRAGVGVRAGAGAETALRCGRLVGTDRITTGATVGLRTAGARTTAGGAGAGFGRVATRGGAAGALGAVTRGAGFATGVRFTDLEPDEFAEIGLREVAGARELKLEFPRLDPELRLPDVNDDEREDEGREVGRENDERLSTVLDDRFGWDCTIGVRAGAGEVTYDDDELREDP
jgi:hypothetical protein